MGMRKTIELKEGQAPLDHLVPFQEAPRKSFYRENGIKSLADVLPNAKICSDVIRFFKYADLPAGRFIKDTDVADESRMDFILLLEELGIIRADWQETFELNHKPVGSRPIPIAYDANKVRDTIDLINAVHKDLELLNSFGAQQEYFQREEWRRHTENRSLARISYDHDSHSLMINKTTVDLSDAPNQADLCRVIFANWPEKKSWERDEILAEWGWEESRIYRSEDGGLKKEARLPVYTAANGLNRKISEATQGKIIDFLSVSTKRVSINPPYYYLLANT